MNDREKSLRDIIVQAETYLDIERNPEFTELKEKIIIPQLRVYIEGALGEKLDTDESKNRAISNIIRYQELVLVSHDIFAAWQQAANTSRENIKKIS